MCPPENIFQLQKESQWYKYTNCTSVYEEGDAQSQARVSMTVTSQLVSVISFFWVIFPQPWPEADQMRTQYSIMRVLSPMK